MPRGDSKTFHSILSSGGCAGQFRKNIGVFDFSGSVVASAPARDAGTGGRKMHGNE